MLKTLISLILLSSFAYASTPTFTVGTDPLIDITSTGTGLSLGDDNMSGMKNIGFDFTFYDQTFSQVNISMNGFFTFQNNFSVSRSRNYRSETLPATSFNYSVFPAWSDFIRRSSGNQSPYIQTFEQTSDTDQYFVIMWDNVSEYSNGLKSTFQAILYETTNEIAFRYDELRIQNHDITIGLQGNNEAVTYLRYEDTGSTTFIETDDFSVSTAIDESFSNLSSECLIDSDFSELCDVYDLTNDSEEEDYLYGTGLTDAMLYGYDDEEDFYGFDEEDEYLYGETTFLTFTDDWHNDGDSYDVITISSDILFVEEYDLEEPIFIDTHFEFTEDSFAPDLEEISFIPLEDITDTEVIDIFEIHIIDTEEDFLMFVEEEFTEEQMEEIEEHFEEHFEEEFREEEFEQFAETEEEIIEEELEQDFTEEEFIEQELELLDNIDDEEKDTKKEKRNKIRSIVASTNSLLEKINPNITGGTSQTSTTVSVSSNTSGASSSPMSVSSSPSISDQIASSQAQTNTVLQSINLVPMPAIGNTPSTMMAEVQVTTMDNQIESMTSTMVTASEADQIAEQIVASNIRAQQEQSQQQEQESGTYDTQGQATLLAYMNYLPGFDTYQDMSIPQPTEWYEPRAIYTDVTIDDNYVGYGIMLGSNINTLSGMVSEQSEDLFGG
jgi:hypothetical protein